MPFTPVHFMAGPVVVTWNGIQLGYSEDGVPVRIQPFHDSVKSDDFGGRAGPDADAQILAGIATVNVPLTKYMKAEMDKLSSFRSGGTAGIFPPIGSFVRQDGMSAILILDGVNEDMTFATAFLKGAFEINSGTRFRRYMIGFECWVNQTDYTSLQAIAARTLFTIG